jgi:tungstate transport system ATP-binding protein
MAEPLQPQSPAGASILPLQLQGVGYCVGDQRVLQDINARFEAGRRSVIVGPNGAGKSVLMRLCHGLLPASSGQVCWEGAREQGLQPAHYQAMVFQRPVLLRRSVLDNLLYALALQGVAARAPLSRRDAAAQREARAIDALHRVGLAHLAQRQARVLSGGEQQRVALARAWVLSPQVLFLDEPTANLDPHATREIEAVIDAIHQAGTRIIMSTHNLGQARRLADDIVFLSQGRLIEHTASDQFFSQPRSSEAAAFIQGELPWV